MALEAGRQKAMAGGDPLVVLLHGWYTGDDVQYAYWDSFVAFLDLLPPQATFVTTQQLVETCGG